MSYQREFKKRLKVAMIGIGSHAYRNLLPALNFLPVELKAVCNRSNKEMADLTAAQYGCHSYQDPEKMYEKEDLDAVFLCASPQAHPELTIQALHAGLHVWMEKPAAMNAGQVERMIAERGDKVVLVGYKKAFMPATKKAIEVVHSEKYGNLESMLVSYPMTMPEDWEGDMRENKRNDWLNNGCHPLSVMLAVGGPVESVISIQGKMRNGANIIKFKSGAVGNLHLASGPVPMEDFRFYSGKWNLRIDNNSKVILERGIPFVYEKTTSFTEEGDDSGAVVWEVQNCRSTLENQAAFIQGIYNEMMEFCNCILEDRKPTIGSLEFALELKKVLEALAVSEGKEIFIQ